MSLKLHAPLVSTDWLAQNIDNALLRIFDATVLLTPNDPDPGYTIVSGREAWAASHIPGAGFIDLLAEFSDQSVPLPLTMLPAEQFAQRVGEAGIGEDSAVVIYGAGSMMFKDPTVRMDTVFGDGAEQTTGFFGKLASAKFDARPTPVSSIPPHQTGTPYTWQ